MAYIAARKLYLPKLRIIDSQFAVQHKLIFVINVSSSALDALGKRFSCLLYNIDNMLMIFALRNKA